ncbi:MAG: DUF4421 family protein [Chitinophagaceae bacterium]
MNFTKSLIQCLVISALSAGYAHAQQYDTAYIEPYQQRIRLLGFVSTSSIEIGHGDEHYSPNYPLTAGIGLSVKNTILGMELGYGFLPLKKTHQYGKSKTMDLQLHNYGKKIILDGFLQSYKGFYSWTKAGEVNDVFPDMAVIQIGAEATYIFNGEKYSSKAAFYLNEIQKQSAGTWLLGGGTYFYRIKGLPEQDSTSLKQIENLQFGVNGGYAYSWVIDSKWVLSSFAKVGANFGNTPKSLRHGKLEIYPTAFARFAGSYQKKDWGVSMAILLNNKSVYPLNNEELSLTTITMQLSYVKHIDHIFKKEKE